MSLGSQLKRAEMFTTDSSGQPIRRVHRHAIGYTVMPVKETAPHALSHANTETTEEQEEQARKEREARARFDALDSLDVQILRLHLIRKQPREYTMPFPASSREDKEAAGWLFVRYEKKGRIAMMVKSFVGQYTHAEIAERVRLTVHQVRRRLSALDPLLVKFAEMRGWL